MFFFNVRGLLGQIAKSCVMSMDWVINSNIGFCFCLEVFGEGEYVVCVYIMNEWIIKGQKGELEFNHIRESHVQEKEFTPNHLGFFFFFSSLRFFLLHKITSLTYMLLFSIVPKGGIGSRIQTVSFPHDPKCNPKAKNQSKKQPQKHDLSLQPKNQKLVTQRNKAQNPHNLCCSTVCSPSSTWT